MNEHGNRPPQHEQSGPVALGRSALFAHHDFGVRVSTVPRGPKPPLVGQDLQGFILVESRYTEKCSPRMTDAAEPDTLSLHVIEHEGGLVGPTACGKGQGRSFQFPAVHDSPVNEWSVSDGNMSVADGVVHHLAVEHIVEAVCSGLAS